MVQLLQNFFRLYFVPHMFLQLPARGQIEVTSILFNPQAITSTLALWNIGKTATLELLDELFYWISQGVDGVALESGG